MLALVIASRRKGNVASVTFMFLLLNVTSSSKRTGGPPVYNNIVMVLLALILVYGIHRMKKITVVTS